MRIIKSFASYDVDNIRDLSIMTDNTNSPTGDYDEKTICQHPEALENIRLKQKIETLEQQIESERLQFSEEYQKVRQEAYEEALIDFKANDAEKLRILQETSAQALAKFGEKLDELEGLALLFSQEALSLIFSDTRFSRSAVSEMISHQVNILRRDVIIKIFVSDKDFPSDINIQELKNDIQCTGLDILIDPELSVGESRIDLRVGTIELSVKRQWEKLQGTIQALLEEASVS